MISKSRRMIEVGRVVGMGEFRNVCQILLRKLKVKIQLQKPVSYAVIIVKIIFIRLRGYGLNSAGQSCHSIVLCYGNVDEP
jgi:hypothetical protein